MRKNIVLVEVNKEKIRYILQFCFDKGKKASQAEIVNAVYGPDTITPNYAQFWIHRFRSAFFMFKMHLTRAGPLSKMSINHDNGRSRSAC